VSYLEYVLGKVRESDIDRFRKKIEPVERERDKITHDQGLEHIDDIVQRKSDKMLDPSSMQINDASNVLVDQPINQEEKSTEDKSDEDVFAKFLKTIRG